MALIKAASLNDIINGPRPKMFAIQHYGHKTGGEILLVTKEEREMIEKKTRRNTYGSYLGRMMR
jgi:hypothetical protein